MAPAEGADAKRTGVAARSKGMALGNRKLQLRKSFHSWRSLQVGWHVHEELCMIEARLGIGGAPPQILYALVFYGLCAVCN